MANPKALPAPGSLLCLLSRHINAQRTITLSHREERVRVLFYYMLGLRYRIG